MANFYITIRYFTIKNHGIWLMYRLLIYLIIKLLTMSLDFEIVDIIFIILSLHNLVKNYLNF